MISCEIDFPALPTLANDERLRMRFENPIAVLRADTLADVRGVLASVMAESARGNTCVGYVSYEAAPAFDRVLVVKNANEKVPLAWFAVFPSSNAREISMPETPLSMRSFKASPPYEVGAWQSDTDAAAFATSVETIRADIREGRFYQVNYTMSLGATFKGDAHAFHRALQAAQPNGYHAYIDTGEAKLLSVSPELFFSMRDGIVTTQPMKGTAPRGDSSTADAAQAEYLTHSEKERAENLMIVDLLRNDLSRIAKPHSVEVPHLFSLHALPTVWQMTSTVRASLRDDATLVDIFDALFPCGSITGAPKVEAMRAIAELEAAPRGAYCGAIGYVAPGGVACFNVGIRSVWIDGNTARCGVGSGITFDSTVEGEAAELAYKARFVKRASTPFALFETIRLEESAFALLERHLDRIEQSARHFRFQWHRADAMRALDALKSQYPRGVWRVRLTGERDGSVHAEAHAMPATPAEPHVRLAREAVSSSDEFLQHKTTRREVYDAHSDAAGDAFDVLLWNERGELTEFTKANVVLELDGERVTPPLSCGLLNGTLREELIALGRVTERVLTRDDLARASAIYWVNGLRGEVQVTLRGD
jgi:para-aminobenzoate synthetase / 4-amino-4-deoxychorismate lyase